jgi:hypothetical protein
MSRSLQAHLLPPARCNHPHVGLLVHFNTTEFCIQIPGCLKHQFHLLLFLKNKILRCSCILSDSHLPLACTTTTTRTYVVHLLSLIPNMSGTYKDHLRPPFYPEIPDSGDFEALSSTPSSLQNTHYLLLSSPLAPFTASTLMKSMSPIPQIQG